MLKRGGGKRWNNGDKHNDYGDKYNEREKRRVYFKPTNYKKGPKNKNAEMMMRHLTEDDVDMGSQNGFNNATGFKKGFRKNRRDGRMNSPAPKSNYVHRSKLMQGTSPWYQVTIPYGKQYEKPFLLNTLHSNMSPDIFVPYFYSYSANAAVFYVDDFAMAEKLHELDRQIGMPNGFKLGIKVRNGAPSVNMDDKILEKMKLAMAGRYNAVTKALDLTKFYADPVLEDVFCALFRPTIMLAAINIMAENIPDLQALNLNDNKLHVLDHFKNLLKKLPNLKILYLGNNRIPHVNSLEPLKGLPLVELFLEGNPLADRFKEKEAYVSFSGDCLCFIISKMFQFSREVRKRFPKIVRLDGKDLPPVIGFDINDVNLPPRKASFLCNMEGSNIVKQFLEQYFAIYDSESRQPLLDAYHESAVFSLTAWHNHSASYVPSGNRLNTYVSNGHNLLRMSDDTRRKYVKLGRLQVVSLLNDLPRTQHDPLSFCVDMTICTQNLIMLTVNGVFKETSSMGSSSKSSSSPPPLRAFHKTMIIVPHGGGFCIKNDMLHITTPTQDQEDNSFKPPTIVNAPPPPSYGSPAVQQPVAVTSPIQQQQQQISSPQNSGDPQQQMIQALCLQTNMNMEWSRICLEQTSWDFQRAILVFNNLNSEGKIPPEAFIK